MVVALNSNALITAIELDTFLKTTIKDSLTVNVSNKYLDFNIGAGELNAVIAEGTYTIGNIETEADSLCKAIYDAIVAAEATGTYTVRVVSDTIIITRSAGTFQILWKTGTHGSDNTDDHIGTLIGYNDTADDTGSLSYTADNTIGRDYANTLINFASDFIQNYCNRKFIKNTYTSEEYDGNGALDLYLKNFPIISVTSIDQWDTFTDSSEYTFTVNTEYLIYSVEGYIYMRGGWYRGRKNFQITYVAGYLIADVPYDLKKACADLCSLMKNLGDKAGMKSEKIGNYSYQLGSQSGLGASIGGLAIPAEILSLLIAYRPINI